MQGIGFKKAGEMKNDQIYMNMLQLEVRNQLSTKAIYVVVHRYRSEKIGLNIMHFSVSLTCIQAHYNDFGAYLSVGSVDIKTKLS